MSARNSLDGDKTGSAGVLEITRVFEAPRALVFKAWTDVAHLARWWGPKGFTVMSYKADARVGGKFRFGIRSPEGTEHWANGVYKDVTPHERLVFTTAWEGETGASKRETLVTITFTARGNKTEMHFHQAEFESATARDLHNEGWSETFDLLADYLKTM
ncbi:MAG TPA: SRPBCC domain-containing protein [Dongiaceae bacterium]